MTDTPLCQYCGAYSRRSCEYQEMTGMPLEAAPCQFDDEWDMPDPDLQKENRDEMRRLEREEGGFE